MEGVRTQGAGDDTSVLTGLGAPGLDTLDLPQLEDHLRDLVEQADRRHDRAAGRRWTAADGRGSAAAAQGLPRCARVGRRAMALDPRPADRLRAVVVRHATSVLLGGGARARSALAEAAAAAEAAGERALGWRLLGMRVLVAHDLGDADFEALWERLEQRVLAGTADEMVPELAAIGLRVLVEREELDRAMAMSSALALAGNQNWPLLEHLARLAGSDLAAGLGDHRHAADLLRSVVEEGRATGCTLFVAEAAARLVVLEADHDRAAARTAFEVYGRRRRRHGRRASRGVLAPAVACRRACGARRRRGRCGCLRSGQLPGEPARPAGARRPAPATPAPTTCAPAGRSGADAPTTCTPPATSADRPREADAPLPRSNRSRRACRERFGRGSGVPAGLHRGGHGGRARRAVRDGPFRSSGAATG
jgi:hypothetical protein